MKISRKSGILLHPTSLPCSPGIGTFGKPAFDFVDWLASAGISLWQVLPLGPTGFGDSPYQSFSAFALNPLLIDFNLLAEKNWAKQEDIQIPEYICSEGNVNYGAVVQWKKSVFEVLAKNIKKNGGSSFTKEFSNFEEKNRFWLDDYSLFMCIKADYDSKGMWNKAWPEALRDREPSAIEEWKKTHRQQIFMHKVMQFFAFSQWNELHEYANKKGIEIIGDIPIFVSPDSADVWANQNYFQLDKNKNPKVVAGVPPDYFSPTGQLWGNPLYDWKKLEENNFDWWINRVVHALKITDYVRIDHFRGFDSYWAVKNGSKTAENGKWMKGPGIKLFNAIKAAAGDLPLIAEDLGEITESVRKLREKTGLPGMKILQFGFDTNEYYSKKLKNSFLPHNYSDTNFVSYTGTHDNDTTQGSLNSMSNECLCLIASYIKGRNVDWEEARNLSSSGELCRSLVAKCFESIASFAIVPLQDLYCFGSDCRMNTPGTGNSNWAWRMREDLLYGEKAGETAKWLADLNILYAR